MENWNWLLQLLPLALAALAIVKWMAVRFDDMNKRFDDMHRRLDDMHKRFDDMQTLINSRIDDLRTVLQSQRTPPPTAPAIYDQQEKRG